MAAAAMRPLGSTIPKLGLFLIFLLSVGLTFGKITVPKGKITLYLQTYFKNIEKETGVPETSADSIIKKFTDGTTMSKAPGVTLMQLAEVLISVEEDSAITEHEKPCVMSDQVFIDSLYASGWDDRPFQETFQHIVSVDNSGKKFCNVFAYLRCQTQKNPKTGVDEDRCLCPSRMIWQDDKCVFKIGEKCHDISGLKAEDKPFPVFDYKTEDFTRIIPSICAGKSSKCRHGGSNTCEIDKDFEYDASVPELANFLRKHITEVELYGDFDEGTIQLEMLRHALKDITKHYRQPFRRALSLELHLENNKLEHGSPCNFAVESTLAPLLDKYNKHKNPDSWNANGNDIGLDTVRMQFLKQVKVEGIKICNPFLHLKCTSSNVCDCIEPSVFEKYSREPCVFKEAYRCNILPTKQFKLSREVDPGKFALLGISYYNYATPECIWIARHCESFDNFGEFCVTGKDRETSANAELQNKFEDKFSIEINGACQVDEQVKLFKTLNRFSWDLASSLDEAKTIMRTVIGQPTQFCRIRQHSICSEEDKCICVKPTIAQGKTCTMPNNWKCNSVIQSEFHEQLDRINLPLTESKKLALLVTQNQLTCGSNIDCFCYKHKNDNWFEPCLESICTCIDGKHGEQCEKHPIHHLAHLDYQILPNSMTNPEGFKILLDLHEPITQLDAKMTLEYDQSCDPNTDQELEGVFGFLALVREECDCNYLGEAKWRCAVCDSDKPEIQKPKFAEALKTAQSLAAKTGAVFCNWNRALRCVDKKCGCAPTYFFEDNHCRVDLGNKCSKLKINDDYLATCRSGLECVKHDHYKPHRRCLLDNSCDNCDTPIKFVSHAKKILKEKLDGKDKELLKRQQLLENQNCSQEDEKYFKTVLSKFKMLKANTDSTEADLENERQDIRLMEDILVSADDLLLHFKLCKADHVCSEKTNKCEEKTKKENSAAEKFQQISILVLNLVGFCIILISK